MSISQRPRRVGSLREHIVDCGLGIKELKFKDSYSENRAAINNSDDVLPVSHLQVRTARRTSNTP